MLSVIQSFSTPHFNFKFFVTFSKNELKQKKTAIARR